MVNGQSHVALPSARRRARVRAIASTLLLGLGIALAAPGDLDPGFNGNGLLSVHVSDTGSAPLAVVQQSDGQLVFAGFGVYPDHGADVAVVRVAADGTLDGTFGTDGITSADFAGQDDIAGAVLQQTDGKLVVAGRAGVDSDHHDIALARFNADGTLDATFGTNGWATLNIGGSDDFASGLVEQSGGKLVVAGRTNSGGSIRLLFARFNADGTLDTTFGAGGTTLVDFGGSTESEAFSLAQQPDGKLVAVGRILTFVPSLEQDIAIARVTANGALDPTFDGDGLLQVDIGGSLFAVAIQRNGAIVTAGYVESTNGTSGAALVRFNEDGSVDDTFGTAGMAVVDLGRGSLSSIVVQTDGKLVATGDRSTVGGQDMILARFNSDGTLDTSFGVDGVATADFGIGGTAPRSRGVALIRQTDDKYVAVGPNSSGSIFLAARFDDLADFPGLIGLTATRRNVSETAGTVTYTVRRTGGRTGAVSVSYATTAGQAQPGSDFEDAPGTLSWNDGDASAKTITLNLINDTTAEEDETFTLKLSAPTGGAQLAATEATTIIVSEDGPGQLRFKFPLDVYQVREIDPFGDGAWIRVPVQRTGGSTGPVSVNYSTVDGTATAGADFAATSGTLSWADRETGVKWVEVAILDDRAVESDEEFQIRLSDPTGGATIPSLGGTQLVRIADDELGLGDVVGLDRTIATIGEAGGSVSLNVLRTGSAASAVSVNYATSSGSATADSDFASASGTINWAAGDTAAKTITVNITSDSVDENDETFTITLSNPAGGVAVGSNSSATITIADDDAPGGGGDGAGGGGSGGDGGGGGGGGTDRLSLGLLLIGLAWSRMRSWLARAGNEGARNPVPDLITAGS